MSRSIMAALCLLFCYTPAFSQTLFSYGKDSVTVNEFLQAYHKNNPGKNTTAKTVEEYLNLYIASRLKIKEAKVKGYDTLPQLITELDNLRNQIIPTYLNDAASVNKLVTEAFNHSQKDIHASHIFISFTGTDGRADTIAAKKKAEEVYTILKSNPDFPAAARQYSSDTSAKINGGDLGYITVFTLPYEIENILYATPVNAVAPVYKSKSGYHIFKNSGERKALGKIKAAQILLAFPPGADAATKSSIKRAADSIYTRLQKGDDFGKLAGLYSNDFISASTGGELPEFGVGQYDPSFETAVFNLKDGMLSKPFATTYGYHIVKRIASVPVSTVFNDSTKQLWKDKVEQDERINITKAVVAQRILKEAPYKKTSYNPAELWTLTDSILDYKPITSPLHINSRSALFTLGDKAVTVSNWTTYAQMNRYKRDGTGLKPYSQLWDEFVQASALDYYKDHLETYNADFRQQINEFKEGNLFFEIMQRQIWGPAQSDTTALQTYYQQHKQAYQWKESADAVIFYANNQASANDLYAQIKKTPANWKTLVTAVSDKVAADSNRFEISQIPGAGTTALKAGAITVPLVNQSDHTASFAYIIKTYPQPAQRSFAEAKGLLVNDYQTELEEKWIKALKDKYPVHINEKALSAVEAAR